MIDKDRRTLRRWGAGHPRKGFRITQPQDYWKGMDQIRCRWPKCGIGWEHPIGEQMKIGGILNLLNHHRGHEEDSQR